MPGGGRDKKIRDAEESEERKRQTGHRGVLIDNFCGQVCTEGITASATTDPETRTMGWVSWGS